MLMFVLLGAGCSTSTTVTGAPSDGSVGSVPAMPQANNPTPTGTLTGSPSPAAVRPNGAVTPSYRDALMQYQLGSGNYFQFSGCHVLPPNPITLKAGTRFMIDNRDSKTHTYVYSGHNYRVAGYGFAIATAPTKVGTYPITCDGGGAASLNIEK